MSLKEIRLALHKARTPYFPVTHTGDGFYSIYLKANFGLPFIDIPEDRLLYVGMTRKGFLARDHCATRTVHCSFRRSLACLLKEELGLSPVAKSTRFGTFSEKLFGLPAHGEGKLSHWMKGALYISRVPFSGDVRLAETKLITALKPPLNLTGWTNPEAKMIKAKRQECLRLALKELAA